MVQQGTEEELDVKNTVMQEAIKPLCNRGYF